MKTTKKIEFERRSLLLTEQEWQTLETLAAQHDACAPTGVNAGQPAWRTLIKRLADGDLSICKPTK